MTRRTRAVLTATLTHIPLLLLLIFITFPDIVAAAPLTPNEAAAGTGFIPCDGTKDNPCTSCHVIVLANTIIKWLIGMVFLLFAYLAVVAGFKMVVSGGNPSALQTAKSSFTNAFIGLMIVLAAWLIVDTLLRSLIGTDGKLSGGEISGYGPWAQVKCETLLDPKPVREGNDPKYTSESGVGSGADAPKNLAEGTISHAAAAAKLPSEDFSVRSTGGCTDRAKSNCTSLDGVRPTTIDRIVELQGKVGEKFIVTGGTEAGHASGEYSHANGYKLDLSTTPKLNEYIYSNFTKIGDTKYKDGNGNTYYRHGPDDHWDITITN